MSTFHFRCQFNIWHFVRLFISQISFLWPMTDDSHSVCINVHRAVLWRNWFVMSQCAGVIVVSSWYIYIAERPSNKKFIGEIKQWEIYLRDMISKSVYMNLSRENKAIMTSMIDIIVNLVLRFKIIAICLIIDSLEHVTFEYWCVICILYNLNIWGKTILMLIRINFNNKYFSFQGFLAQRFWHCHKKTSHLTIDQQFDWWVIINMIQLILTLFFLSASMLSNQYGIILYVLYRFSNFHYF